jgi:diguanylate cyclase (GGDEF)-like protein
MPVIEPAGIVATSLRSRLAVVLAVLLMVPLIVALVVAAVIVPRSARSSAERAAGRDADSLVVALSSGCEGVRAATTAAARQAAAYAVTGHGLTAEDAHAVAVKAALARPGAAVAILAANGGRTLGVAGVKSGQRTAAHLTPDASCGKRRIGITDGVAGLAEVAPVATLRPSHWIAYVAIWVPLDDAALQTLRAGLRTDGQLSLLPMDAGPDSSLLASSATGEERPQLTDVAHQAAAGPHQSGVRDGIGYALRPPSAGVPFTILTTTAVGPMGSNGLLWPIVGMVIAIAALVLLPIQAAVRLLTRPMTEELLFTAGQLEVNRVALADTFERFGEALQYTHDLDKLLTTVTAAYLRGTGAVAGAMLLTDNDGLGGLDRHSDDDPDSGSYPQIHGNAHAPGTVAVRAAAELPAFAMQYFRGLSGDSTAPLFARLPIAGPVVGVPIHAAGRLTGVLVLARGEGAGPFDALALPRVRRLADDAGTAIANVRRHEEVRRLSLTDPLTGVGNLRHLSTTLSREIAGAIRSDLPLTVLMLDIDHFKQVNDTFGHQFGDVVLRDFARRLLSIVRESDMVMRYGGEEFAIVLPVTDVDGGSRLAERILGAVRMDPFRHGEIERAITVSIGVAAFPRDGRTAEEVLKAADEALYAAKHQGRDRWQIAEVSPPAPVVSQAG